jgi:exodeoxyribonuclease-3
LRDVVRERWPAERVFTYTYWDYRADIVPQGHGDADRPGARLGPGGRPDAGGMGGSARPQGQRAERPRPVIVDLDQAPDGDIEPVVPPLSTPFTKDSSTELPQSRCQASRSS